MGQFDIENLRNLKAAFGLDEDEDLQSLLDRIALDLKMELLYLGKFDIIAGTIDCDTKIVVVATASIKDRQYTHAEIVRPGVSPAPLFRGWWADVNDKILLENNRTS